MLKAIAVESLPKKENIKRRIFLKRQHIQLIEDEIEGLKKEIQNATRSQD